MLFQWKYSGLILSFASSTFVSLSTMMVSYMSGIQPYTKSLCRFAATVIPASIILLFHWARRKEGICESFWPPNNRQRITTLGFILFRSLIGCSSVLFHYYSLKYMSLPDSSTIVYSTPVFVAILAHFFLHETLGIFSLLTTLVALAGVVCITRPPFLTGETVDIELMLGAALALASALCRGVAVVILRFLKNVHYSFLLFVFGAWGTLQSLLLAWNFDQLNTPVTVTNAALLAGMGLLSCAGQLCLVLALKAENAGPVSLVRSCDVIFAFMWQLVLFDELPGLYSILGASIILFGVLMAAFRRYIDSLEEDDPQRGIFWFVLK